MTEFNETACWFLSAVLLAITGSQTTTDIQGLCYDAASVIEATTTTGPLYPQLPVNNFGYAINVSGTASTASLPGFGTSWTG